MSRRSTYYERSSRAAWRLNISTVWLRSSTCPILPDRFEPAAPIRNLSPVCQQPSHLRLLHLPTRNPASLDKESQHPPRQRSREGGPGPDTLVLVPWQQPTNFPKRASNSKHDHPFHRMCGETRSDRAIKSGRTAVGREGDRRAGVVTRRAERLGYELRAPTQCKGLTRQLPGALATTPTFGYCFARHGSRKGLMRVSELSEGHPRVNAGDVSSFSPPRMRPCVRNGPGPRPLQFSKGV